MIMYSFGVFFMSCILNYLEQQHHITDTEFLNGLDEKFGTMFRSMALLYEAITGGNDWGELAAELKIIGGGYYLCFALYIMFVSLGVLNIVTGFFVENTMQASENQKDLLLKAARERKCAMVEMLTDLFDELDRNQSGTISLDELQTHLFDDDDLEEYLCVLEMDPEKARDLFMMLDIQKKGEVNIKDFTRGCLKIMDTPRNFDILSCSLQSQRTLDLVEKIAAHVLP